MFQYYIRLLNIFLSLWTVSISQDFEASSLSKHQKRYSLVPPSIKHTRTKPILFKRIPGISSLLPSRNAARILNNKSPLNTLQNGPYYINHYIYCDNIDQHTIDQIKGGSALSNKEIQLLNVNKDQFHSVGGFSGNKEFHVLHLPNNKNHNFNDIKLHLSLVNAHKSPEVPEIDLEVNKHLGSFEVNLEDIKPLELDTSYHHATRPSAHDIVTPLIQGHVSGRPNHKHNDNLIQLADYLNENVHIENNHVLPQFNNFQNSHATHHHTHTETLDLPHFEKHPLEYDSSKASYDTPGALDSYGHPATESSPHISNFNLYPEIPGSFSNGFGNGFKGNDLYQSEDYINQLNEINGLQRRKRMDALISTSTTSTTTEKSQMEAQNKTGVKHSNHKYD